jgi:hypothetical protein
MRTDRRVVRIGRPFVFIVAAMVLCADTWLAPPATRTAVAIDGSARVFEFSSSDNPAQRSIKVYTRSQTGDEALYWQAALINCPVQLFVAPGGDSVVTMNVWGHIGSDALVFYNEPGTVSKRYKSAQADLVTPAESLKIKKSVSSFWWSEGAHAEFTADAQYFWVWLPSGRVMIFDPRTGTAVDAKAVRLDPTRGRRSILRTVEVLSDSQNPPQRIAAARLAGWLNGQAVMPILRKLLSDPYYRDTGRQTKAEDPWGRYATSPFLLLRRVYPVRRAAAEELHISVGQADGAVEELVAR